MAKNPCKFKIKSTGEWVDAVTLKKRLNDGLLDEYVSSGIVKLKSFEAKQPKSDSEQVQESKAPVTETKAESKPLVSPDEFVITYTDGGLQRVGDIEDLHEGNKYPDFRGGMYGERSMYKTRVNGEVKEVNSQVSGNSYKIIEGKSGQKYIKVKFDGYDHTGRKGGLEVAFKFDGEMTRDMESKLFDFMESVPPFGKDNPYGNVTAFKNKVSDFLNNLNVQESQAPVTETKSNAVQNRVVELQTKYNNLSVHKKNTKDGRNMLSEIMSLSSKGGYTVKQEKNKVVVYGENGKRVVKKSERTDAPEVSEDQLNYAKKVIESGLLNWDGDILSYRWDSGLGWDVIRRAERDLKNGKKDSNSIRLVVAEISRQKESGGFNMINGSGSNKGRYSIPLNQAVSENVMEQIDSETQKIIDEQESTLAEEYDAWFLSLDEDSQNEILEEYEGGIEAKVVEDDTEGESKKNVSNETETVQEQVESVTIPPSGNIKRPRTFERIDGEWKLKDGDGHTEVSDSIKQQVQMEYETQQRADQERMTEKAKREKGAVEEKIMKFLDGMKIDPNATRSTILPIPPKVWNGFIDVVKGFIEKGFTFSEAVTKAKREYFAPKVKEGELSKKDVDSAVTKFKNQYNTKVAKQVEAKQGDGTPIGKAIKEAKSEMSDLEAEPAKAKSKKSTYGNRATIRKAIKAYDAGARDATKKLQDIKDAVVEYIKENVDFKDSDTIKGQDSKVMINQVRSAKDMASLKKAFDLIDNVATRQYDRKKKRLINQLKNLVSRKNLISGTGAKKKSKIGVDAEMELKDFIMNIMPTDEQLNNMSLNDLQDYYDMAQGIIEVGKYDVKQKAKFKQRKNRMDQAVAISAWTLRDQVRLNSLDEVRKHLANGGHAIVNGEFVKSVSTLNDIVKSDDDVTEIIGLPFIRGIKETTQTPWYKKNFNPSKNKLFYNNLFRYLYKNKEIKTLLEEKIVNPLTEAEIRKDDEIKQVTSEIIKKINNILGVSRTSEVALGKTTKAMLRLNEIPKGKSFRKELGSGETDIFTNNALVMMYSHLQTEGGKEMLESSVNHINTDAVIEYIESQPDLKKLSEYFVDNLLVDMKQIIDPIYEDLHGIKLPEGKYFPRYVDVDSINDNYTTQTLTSDDGVRASSVIASAFNDRVSRTPQLDLTKGATDIINEYVKSVIYTKHFLPVAQNFDAIVNNPVSKKYIIDLIGQSRHDDLVINVNSAITGKNPYAANRIEPIMKIVNNTIVPIAAIVQVGGKFTKSAVNQSVAIISYATAGIKYGVYPTDVLRGARPLNKQELEVFKNWVFKKGGYTSRRYFDSQYDHMHIRLDKALTKWSKSTGKAKALAYTEFSRVVDATIKTYMSGILVGDFISVGAGGSAFNLAMYRKAKDNGMGHEQAMDWAYMKTAEETNLTQQSASISAKSNTQRETLSPLVLAYRSGQVAMLNKIIGSFQVLSKINKDIYSSREKVQAFADLFQFTTQMYVYNLIASGALNYMLGGDDDDETKSQYSYRVTMDTVQSMLQGYGWWGAALDMTLNAGRGKEFFNTIPAAKLIQEGATTSFWTVVKGADYGYDELTDTEVNKLQKTVGWKNIQTQIDNFNQYMKDEKSLYDAIMNYDPDKGPIEGNDYIYDKIGWMFGGEPIGGSGGSGGGPSGEGGPDEGNPNEGNPNDGGPD